MGFQCLRPSAETTLQARLLQSPLWHRLPYNLQLQKMTTTSATLHERLQNILPDEFNIQEYTGTANIHHVTSQGDTSLTNTQATIHHRFPTTTISNITPTTPSTTTFGSISTFRCTFEVNSNFKTILFENVVRRSSGSSTSEINPLRNNGTTPQLPTPRQKQPSLQ